ncbi:MAG: thermonuclease family protein, partial [Deltaproteobacteria bacterium]|nr:thermonuclease family protein [Deltaproteobacteria bacterium]
MKKYKGLLALLILFFGFTTAYAHSPLFKVTRVLQGDLIELSGQEGKFTLRLAGIDSPELWQPEPAKSQPFARQARDYLASLIQGKMVKIRSYGGQAG